MLMDDRQMRVRAIEFAMATGPVYDAKETIERARIYELYIDSGLIKDHKPHAAIEVAPGTFAPPPR